MWQALRQELAPHGVEIVTVALDVDPEDARPWIEAAAPDHPSVVDRSHVVDELFGIVNVPNAVWIDEEGTIVRPAGPSHVTPSAEKRIAAGTLDPSRFTPELRELIGRLEWHDRAYVAAVRDWAVRGAESVWAHSPDDVVNRSQPRGDAEARAAAHFELGERLHELGDATGAQRHWREAHRLHPENWTYKRAAWHLVAPREQGPNGVYDGWWLKDVRELGADRYYPPLEP